MILKLFCYQLVFSIYKDFIKAMSHHYVVTVKKATAVYACATGNFTSPTDLNLIVAKNQRLEIYLATPDGLRLLKDVGIYGQIAVIQFFKPEHEKKDFLFLLTATYNAMILECFGKGENIEIITKAHGNVAEKFGTKFEIDIKAAIDPTNKIIGLRLYNGSLKIIPLDKDNPELKAYSIPIDENNVPDINFLHGCTNPALVMIHQDDNATYVKSYEVSLIKKEFVKTLWKQDNVERDAMIIIPVQSPICGAIIIGKETIMYHDGVTCITVTPPIIKRNTITCYAKADSQGLLYLLGDFAGHLFMLFLEQVKKPDSTMVVKDLKVELLGEVSIPECMTYLDNGVIFIGSHWGDSQLIKLITKANENGSYCISMESFTHLSCIIDMAFVDLERQGQGKMVTCSGAFKEGSLKIIRNSTDSIDEIQKLHIRTVPLGESPRQIAYQEETQTFGVITSRLDVQESDGVKIVRPSASTQATSVSNSSHIASYNKPSNTVSDIGQDVEVYNLLIIDQHTFEVLHAHTFMPSELTLSLISAKLGNDPTPYFIVSTLSEDYSEREISRILLYHWEDDKLIQVAEMEMQEVYYSLVEFNGKLLASSNGTVRLFNWTDEKKLELECGNSNNTIALYLKTKGEFVLVGNLMRSVTLLQYKSEERSLKEIARDDNPNWMTAIEILDDDTFLGAENFNNLFVCQKDSTVTTEEEQLQLKKIGKFHLGDSVNVFRRGSLAMQHLDEPSAPTQGCVLFGTVSGAIGLITQIPATFYEFLRNLEDRLTSVTESVGKIEHSFWRSFNTDLIVEPCEGFIDGDLIESFLDLNHEKMTEVAKGLVIDNGNGSKKEATIDDLIKIVEDLTKIRELPLL